MALALAAVLIVLPYRGIDSFTVSAAQSNADFQIENGVLLQYCGNGGDVIIPDSVKAIDGQAFYSNQTIKSVTIPKTVTSIGTAAFFDCRSLTKVTIPNSVKTIESSAFCDCTSLKSITIPSSVTSLGDNAFQNTALTGVTVPSSVKQLPDAVFADCRSLATVSLPDTLTSIGNGAFDGCSALKTVSVPASVKSIGSRAFRDCKSLTQITLPADIGNSVGAATFAGCKALTGITVPSSVTSIYESAFEGCTALSNVTLSKNLTYIDSYAFEGCSALKSISLPSSVTYIGSYAFSSAGLKSIAVPSSVKTVGEGAFSSCRSLTGATVPASVTKLGDAVFMDCRSLQKVTLSAKITAIGDASFANCYSLTGLTLPSTVKTIGDSAFYNCTDMTRVVLPKTLTTVGDGAFYCSGLRQVFYAGSQTQWKKVNVYGSNQPLRNATYYYNGKLLPEVTITQQPADAEGAPGSKLTFTVKATGESLTYLWQISDDDGQTWRNSSVKTASYSETVTAANNKRQVCCVVTDKNGTSVTSKAAVMKIRSTVTITAQPQTAVVVKGHQAKFSVKATGEGLTYQWLVSEDGGHAFRRTDVTTPDYTTTLTDQTNGIRLYCTVTDQYGSAVDTKTVALWMSTLKITTQPQTVVVLRGGQVQFTVKASGEGTSYQWQISDDAGKTWRNSAVKTSVYTTTLTNANNGRRMRCVVSDKFGNSETSRTVVMWMSGLKITAQPVNVTKSRGATVQFTVKAAGEGLSYQWQISDNGGQTWRNSAVKTSVYTTTLTDAYNGRMMRCVVSDKFGNKVTSQAAAMRIQ